MKRVIDGKTYNTKTATEVAHWTNGAFLTDFHYEETLYRTKMGEFFLHGHTTCGDELMPISERCAKKWLEKYLVARLADLLATNLM